MKKEEIYEDVLKEEPEDTESKQYKAWEKRLHKSIGWTTLMTQGKVFAQEDKNGRLKPTSDVIDREVVYDVELGEGGAFTCETQIQSELLSLLVQINERLKRVEARLMDKKGAQ